MTVRRVYMDHAATSWPKSAGTLAAAESYLRDCGATAGRGNYGSSQTAGKILADARRNVATLMGDLQPANIAFCSSGTHALNAALWGVLRPGERVITTSMEHNSVLRPLNWLAQFGIEHCVADVDQRLQVDIARLAEKIGASTKLIAINHASNVTGDVQSLEPVITLAAHHGIPVLVDMSQTLGYIQCDVSALESVKNAQVIVAAAGHKGLGAIPGTGLLRVPVSLQSRFRPLLTGGTGSSSLQVEEDPAWPHSVEVGNLNMPAIASMAVAAVEAVQSSCRDWDEVFGVLLAGLKQLPGVSVIGNDDYVAGRRVPVVSVIVDDWDVHDLANVLDVEFGIEVRAGWHCAALAHQALGTAASGGTLRFSTGRATTLEEVEYVVASMESILRAV